MRKLIHILLALAVFWGLSFAQNTDEAQERRTRTGLKLFRAIIAADRDIDLKAGSDGYLHLAVFYRGDRELAAGFRDELLALGKGDDRGSIQGTPLQVSMTNDLTMAALPQPPAGIFVVEDLRGDLDSLIAYGIHKHVIVYSPFEGDVDRGVLAGLAIETRVRPYINMKTLEESEIRIKAFFLKVAKQYEPRS